MQTVDGLHTKKTKSNKSPKPMMMDMVIRKIQKARNSMNKNSNDVMTIPMIAQGSQWNGNGDKHHDPAQQVFKVGQLK